jgi:TonB family protein
VNAVAKTSDGAIYNISSVLASSSKLDVAVLTAEVKTVPFLPLSEEGGPDTGDQAAVIGSAIAGNDGKSIEGAISKNESDPTGNDIALAALVPDITLGAPLVDESGEVVGVVTQRSKKEETSTVVRPASLLKSMVAEIQPNAVARWPGEVRPTPTPKPRLVYTPKPTYPAEARFSDGVARTGRYRVNFNLDGTAKNVQVMNSTGVEALDAAALKGLGQWKCEPGRDGGYVVVPLTFQSR